MIGLEREEEQRQRENNRDSWMFSNNRLTVQLPSAPLLLDYVDEEDDPPPSYQQAMVLKNKF